MKRSKKSFKAIVTGVRNHSEQREHESALHGKLPAITLKQAGIELLTDGVCPESIWQLAGRRVRITILDEVKA